MVTNLQHKMTQTTTNEKKNERLTAVWQKWRFCASYDSFSYNCSAVPCMKFSGENRHLRQARNRYKGANDDLLHL